MNKILLVGIIAIYLTLLCSCSRNAEYEPMYGFDKRQYQAFEAPEWLWNIPSGNYAIGIAWEDRLTGSGAEETAREFAAIALSRNHGSYIVDKNMIVSLSEQSILDWNQYGFNLVVSADPAFMRNAFTEMQLLDKYETHGYWIGLFGLEKMDVSSEKQSMNILDLPSWCNDKDVITQGDKLYAVASSHQANLMDAFMGAQEQALKQIGRYRIQKVMGRILASDTMLEKSIALETVTQSQNTSFVSTYVIFMRNNETPSYKVFLRLKADM